MTRASATIQDGELVDLEQVGGSELSSSLSPPPSGSLMNPSSPTPQPSEECPEIQPGPVYLGPMTRSRTRALALALAPPGTSSIIIMLKKRETTAKGSQRKSAGVQKKSGRVGGTTGKTGKTEKPASKMTGKPALGKSVGIRNKTKKNGPGRRRQN
ncbi:hypothetical protein RUND412_003591 [Rhizina undulata]